MIQALPLQYDRMGRPARRSGGAPPLRGEIIPEGSPTPPPPLLGGGGAPPLFRSGEPPARPVLLAPPPRDLRGEGSRALNSTLLAGAFGLGLGGGLAPRLAAGAGRGALQGADDAAQIAGQETTEANRLLLQDWQGQNAEWDREGREMDRTRQYLTDELRAQTEATRQTEAETRAAEERRRREELDARRAEGEQRLTRQGIVRELLQLDPESQQAYLDLLHQSGDLESAGLQVPRTPTALDETGQPVAQTWDVTAFRRALPPSMGPEAQAQKAQTVAQKASAEARKATEFRGKIAFDALEKLVRDPRTTSKTRQELQKRQGLILEGIAQGKEPAPWMLEVSQDGIAPMTPAQSASLSLAGVRVKQGQVRLQQGANRLQKGVANTPEGRHQALRDGWREDMQAAEGIGRQLDDARKLLKSFPPGSPQALQIGEQVKQLDSQYTDRRLRAGWAQQEIGKLESRHPELKKPKLRDFTPNPNYQPPAGAAPLLLPPPGDGGRTVDLGGGRKATVRKIR